MSSFLSLVSVENTKMWKRLSTKIVLIILVALIVGLTGLMKAERNMIATETTDGQTVVTSNGQTIEAPDGDWKQQLQQTDESLKTEIAAMEKGKTQFDKNSLPNMKMNLAENEYRIAHDVEPSNKQTFWGIVMSASMANLIALLAVIVCTAVVAGEFSEGTMKTMISRPYHRWQILTAKFIPIFLYTLLLIVLTFATEIGSVAAFFGTSGIGAKEFLWIGNGIAYLPGGLAALAAQGLDFLQVLVYVILAFVLSAIFRSRSLATGISIFLCVGGSLLTLVAEYFSWGKFILFADTNFSSFLQIGAPFYGITLAFALVLSLAYCVVLLFAGFFTFAKRDIS